ncbi:MAG: nucleoside deaminase, partial [Leptolyngbya sp.]|nr:nucleoside deaminase [Candidatus Melainabacteria bacterium]
MSDSPQIAVRNQLMLKALEQAQMSQQDVPVGAVMVKDGNIIGLGANERERKLDPTGHAEIVALKQAAAHLGSWRV